MKLKGVGFFEAHVEKLLLGVMVAVAAGVVVLQRSDGGLLLYGALIEEGRLTSATIERSDG